MPVRSVTGSVPGGRGARARRPGSPRRRPGSRGPRGRRRRAGARRGAGSARRSCRWSPGSRRGRRAVRGCGRGGRRARRAGRAEPGRVVVRRGSGRPRRRRARRAATPRGGAGRSTGCRCRGGAARAPAAGTRAGRWRGRVTAPAATNVPEPVPALEPALGGQLVEGLLGHRARDAEVRGQGAGAREAARRPGACRRGRRRGSGRRPGCSGASAGARSRTSGEGERAGHRSVLSKCAMKWPVPAGHFVGQTSRMTAVLSPTDRTTITRHRERGSDDRADLFAVLDEALVCHVGLVRDGAPVVLPSIFAVDPDGPGRGRHPLPPRLGRRALAAAGARARRSARPSRSSTRLVLARAAFSHSMNYRSAVVMGPGRLVDDESERDPRAAS